MTVAEIKEILTSTAGGMTPLLLNAVQALRRVP